jgi:uncharacterized membrane protein HdeD (DUF308 family)
MRSTPKHKAGRDRGTISSLAVGLVCFVSSLFCLTGLTIAGKDTEPFMGAIVTLAAVFGIASRLEAQQREHTEEVRQAVKEAAAQTRRALHANGYNVPPPHEHDGPEGVTIG